MAKVLMRLIQDIAPDKWQQLNELDKKFNELESKMGFPPSKRYQGLAGAHTNELAIEREWESMAKMEEIVEKAYTNPEYMALQAQLVGIVLSSRTDLYLVL